MKNLILFSALAISFTSSAQSIHEVFKDEEKLRMCGGRYAPSSSPVFGNVSKSGDNRAMADLSARVNQIQTISYSDKSNISSIYMKAKSDRDFTRKSKGQYDQLGAHYQRRGEIGSQVYNHTSNGLNNAYSFIAENANDSVYEILGSKKFSKKIGKFRYISYTNMDVLSLCNMFWR